MPAPLRDGIVVLATLLALAAPAWTTGSLGRRWRGAALAGWSLPLLALPFLYRHHDPAWRCLLAVTAGLLVFKLFDLHRHAAAWEARGFARWLRFLVHPLRLVGGGGTPTRSSLGVRLGRLALAAGEVGLGLALLLVLMHSDWSGASFWTEHAAKLAASYLCLWDGLFRLLETVCRLAGGRCPAGRGAPLLAPTPAAFWRRYNRVLGEFFARDVFSWAGGRRAAWRGVAASFLWSGLLHEYIAAVVIGRPVGYPLLYFALHGAAVIGTARWRPRGARAAAGMALTLLFHLVTSVLVFATFEQAGLPWYSGSARPH